MLGGYMGRFLDVDLSNKKIVEFDFDENTKRTFIGGYGLGFNYIYKNQKAGVDVFDERSILGFVSGPINGTAIPGSPRYTICAKSPLTNGCGDANSGGSFGPTLKQSGFDGIFFNGISDSPVYLLLEDGKAQLLDAKPLWGRDTYSTDDILKEKHGKSAEIACIGKSGEMQSRIACVVTRKGKVAGRSGLGAVMGSKKVKAIVVKGNLQVPIANEDLYKEAKASFLKDIRNDYGDAAWAKRGGTPIWTEIHIGDEDAPIKNWGGGLSDIGNFDGLGAKNIKRYVVKRESCYGCPIGCWSKSMVTDGLYKLTEPSHTPEYETDAMFGSLTLNANYESIIKCNDICNRYGIDTISTGAIVAFAIECYERGIISKKETDGLELTWGNHEAIVSLTKKIAEREGFGEVLADGVKRASEILKKGSEEFAIHIGGQEIAGHHPAFDPSLAIIYAINPTPGRHTQANQNLIHDNMAKTFPEIDFSFCSGGKRDIFKGRAKSLKILTNIQHCINALGMCIFAYQSTDIDTHLKYFCAVTGWDIDTNELNTTGERIMNLRQAFNLREGINQMDFNIPGRILGKTREDDSKKWNNVIDYPLMVEEFYKEMDWDLKTSKPSKKKLLELDLGWLIKDLYEE
jgi:aldehyde:ferredoxin oxidoreductase